MTAMRAPRRCPRRQIGHSWANWRDMAFALTYEPGVLIYNKPSFPDGPPDTRAQLMDWLETAPKGKMGRPAERDAIRRGIPVLPARSGTFRRSLVAGGRDGRGGAAGLSTSQDIIARVNWAICSWATDILGSYAADQAAQMPNLGLTLPRDFVVVVSRVSMVPRAAANPELGELFLSFLMSREGQEALLAEKLRLPAVSLEVSGSASAGAMNRAFGDRLRPVPSAPAFWSIWIRPSAPAFWPAGERFWTCIEFPRCDVRFMTGLRVEHGSSPGRGPRPWEWAASHLREEHHETLHPWHRTFARAGHPRICR